MVLKLLVLLLFPISVFAQKTIDVDKETIDPVKNGFFYTVAGVPFSLYKYSKIVSGSPFFKDEWMKGIATLANGTRAQCDRMKLDLMSGEIIYMDSTGTELIATSPIIRITLMDSASGKNYIFTTKFSATGKKSSEGWYQVLESGTATLYKKIKKVVVEATPFNSAAAEQTINTAVFYFIEISNEVNAVKKLKDIPDVLSDKRKELDEFITANKLSGKTDDGFTGVVAKYNALAVNN